MWINFVCEKGKKFVIRPFTGGVNGISGETINGNMGSLLRRINSVSPTQDYIVLPDQDWLDGVAIKPGVVRQFVATEMVPTIRESVTNSQGKKRLWTTRGADRQLDVDSEDATGPIGASVEWQITGRDEVGGIQLQIIPEYEIDRIHAGSHPDVCPGRRDKKLRSYTDKIPDGARAFDVTKTPEEVGIQIDRCFHIKDLKSQQQSRPKLVVDLLREAPGLSPEKDTAALDMVYKSTIKWVFNVSVMGLEEHRPTVLEVSILTYSFLWHH